MRTALIRLAVVMAVLAVAAVAQSAELKITGPTTSVEPGEFVQLLVQGLNEADLETARVVHFPRDRVVCIPARTWSGGIFITLLNVHRILKDLKADHDRRRIPPPRAEIASSRHLSLSRMK